MSRTVPARGALVAWACLTVAIVAEVVGTSFMGRDKNNPKPLDQSAFNSMFKTASEVLQRHAQ